METFCLPNISGANGNEEDRTEEKTDESSSTSLPKLGGINQVQSQVKKSPRLSPRLEPLQKNNKNEENTTKGKKNRVSIVERSPSNSKMKDLDGDNQSLGPLALVALQVPILNRRASNKSGIQSSMDLAFEAWQQRHRFVAFVPRKVLPELPEMRIAGERCTPLQGVVSFLDVAGFTKLTERLALQADGAERLAKIINKLMSQLVGTLKTGDVIKFSGDAILVLYEPDRSLMSEAATTAQEGDNVSGEGYEDHAAMIDAANRAVSEGLEALFDDYLVTPEELGDFGDPDDPVSKEGIKLALHVAICAGDLELMHVGGCYGRWEVLMAGTAMLDLGPTADHAPTDHLAIESKCWKLLEADSRGNQFNGVDIEGGFVRILGEKSNEAKDARHAKHASGDIVDPNELAERFVTYEDMEVLLRYVTPVIQRAVTAGTLEAVSSFTDVSVLFLGISGVDLAAKCEDSSMIWGQVIMGTVQASVFDHEGAVNKFVMDDKGALLLCAWGLPPMAHADDPHRATQAALNISTQLEALGIKAHIGVTTGKVFAGVIGPPHRCEYSLLGDTVNLSARLMGKAPFGGVLCDLGTYTSAVATGMDFEVLEPIKVKGKEHLQAVFKPVVKAAEQSDQATPLRSKPKNARASMWQGNTVDNFDSGAKLLSEGKMRTKERQELLNILDRFYKGSGGTVVLTGDAGTGKSELAKLVLKSTANYDSLLIESLTPKKKGLLSEVISKPCIELSQILQGLLSFHTQLSTSNKIVAAEAGGGGDSRRRKFSEKDRSLSYTFDFSTDFEEPDKLPTTVEGWRERLKACIGVNQLENVIDYIECFDDYFAEWVDEVNPIDSPSPTSTKSTNNSELKFSGKSLDHQCIDENKEYDRNMANATEGQTKPARKSSSENMKIDEDSSSFIRRRISQFENLGGSNGSIHLGGSMDSRNMSRASFREDGVEEIQEDPLASARRLVLSALLDHILSSKSAKPLMIFVHVRTGSSLNVVHPEMWPLLQHLSEYATARSDSVSDDPDKPIVPLVVAFTHRRIVDFAGGSQSESYSQVIANAEKCGGLVQLGPLDAAEREDYLQQSLNVASVPPEIKQWVSNVANGNPQYIEICAKEVDKPEIMKRVDPIEEEGEGALPHAVMNEETGKEALQALTKPRKIVGFIKQVLGSLGPQDKFIVQVLSLFGENNMDFPVPTIEVLQRAFESIAVISYERMEEVLGRLVLYGLVEAHVSTIKQPNSKLLSSLQLFGSASDPKNNPTDNLVMTKPTESGETTSSDHHVLYYKLTFPLLKEMAEETLLKNQKLLIISAITGQPYTTSST